VLFKRKSMFNGARRSKYIYNSARRGPISKTYFSGLLMPHMLGSKPAFEPVGQGVGGMISNLQPSIRKCMYNGG